MKFRYAAHLAGIAAIVLPSLASAQQRPKQKVDSLTSGLLHVVITGDETRRRNLRSLDQLFQGEAPDIMSSGAETGMSTLLRSRGVASPVSWATPRVYLNGVRESFTSLREISPEVIDSVVIMPGAVAGTFEGTGSSGGVVKIYTRRGQAGKPLSVSGKTVWGFDRSLYDKKSKSFKQYLVSAWGGQEGTTYYLGGGTSNEGEWAPSYSDKIRHGIASLTASGQYGSLTGFWRGQRDIATPPDDRLPAGSPATPDTFSELDTAVTTTYGGSADLILAPAWTLHASGGVSRAKRGFGSRLVDVDGILDTTISGYHSNARQTSFTTRTTIRLSPMSVFVPSITAGFDQSVFANDIAASVTTIPNTSGSSLTQRFDGVFRGYFASLGLRSGNVFVLNAGARRDTKLGNSANDDKRWHPRADAALSLPTPAGRFTVRGGVGEVVTAVMVTMQTSLTSPPSFPTYALEDVHTVEAGADVSGMYGALGVTVYDQRGRNGAVNVPTVPSTPPAGLIFQDAGAPRNKGLSAYLRTAPGPLAFRAEYSTVRSDFAAAVMGVPLLQPNTLPNAVGHAAITYTADSAHISLDARYAASHHGIDATNPGPDGKTYPAFLTYDVNASHPFGKDGTFIVFVQNILNAEKYDETNFSYVRGRRIGAGFRFGTY